MRIVIPVEPVAKGRPRFGKNGNAYTPQKTRDYEELVRWYAKSAKIRPLAGDLRVSVCFYLPIPKSWTKAKKQAAAWGKLRPSVKPDIDNLAKSCLDALNNGIGYYDDKQIVELHMAKFYGEPRTVIEMEEI